LLRRRTRAALPPTLDVASAVTPETASRRDAEWLSDARWQYEFHDKRSNSAQTRAVSVMAFSGALLALVPRLVTTAPTQINSAKIIFVVTGIAAVAAIGMAVAALWPRTVNASDIQQMRGLWAAYRDSGREHAGDRNHQATENLLLSSDPSSESPLEDIRNEASSRMNRLNSAYLALSFALVGTAVLGIQKVVTLGGTP
jgi:hypothetical protein